MKSTAALLVFLAAPAFAHVTVSNAFARATVPGAETGVVYLTLQSDTDDSLTGASTPAAGSAMLHQTTMEGMVMAMDMLDKIDLPAGQSVTLAPGKKHIMLEKLTAPLVKGGSLVLHLTFAHAAAMDVTVPVAGIAANAPGE
jgi:periplasmic copper chaperone A